MSVFQLKQGGPGANGLPGKDGEQVRIFIYRLLCYYK